MVTVITISRSTCQLIPYLAKIARLPPVFGLYTSFIGTILYPLFGTSKDVSLGMSLILFADSYSRIDNIE